MSLHHLSKQKELKVIGIMNGTSIDGVDFVLTKIKKGHGKFPKVKFLAEKSFSFPASLKKQLHQAASNQLKVYELGLLHHDLGRFYAQCYKKLSGGFKSAHLIGLHGQTVFHQAPKATLQIGEASYLSDIAGVPVIADFRVSDLALGGQGAPIATLFHQVAFGKGERISVHNLGGISNLSLIDSSRVEMAFDTGPANMLMDLCMKKVSRGKKSFDKGGAFAKRGTADLGVVAELMKHKYFNAKPPKSCGREEFGEVFFNKFLKLASKLSPADKMATLLEFTAWTIALSYKKYVKRLPKKIIFCGGGAKNKALLERISELLPGISILTSEDYGVPVSAIEGAAFALLAAYKAWEMTSNLPKSTGARRGTSMGKIVEV